MSISLHGIGLGGGISIGKAYILDKHLDNAVLHLLEDSQVDLEAKRFEQAVRDTRKELESLRGNIPSNAPAELGAFLSLNIMMLGDSQISQAPLNIIRTEFCNAEWAIKLQAEKLSEQFDTMEDEYLKERKYDVIQVLERIFKNLEGNQFDWNKTNDFEGELLITYDLSPADLMHIKNSNFLGFVTEVGSLTSHTAIIGRNLEIPSIVGVSYARQVVRDGDTVIVDGINGALIIDPDAVVLSEYYKLQKEWQASKLKLRHIRQKESVTLDDVTINLFANIENDSDAIEVKNNNADGVGLFRSEFLFLNNDDNYSDEEEQFEAYSKVVKTLKKLPVTIRTADLGADKNPSWNVDGNSVLNPALGLTGIRLSLADLYLFRSQLRAILRASHYGNIQIMFPMISSSLELKQAIYQLEYVKDELIQEGINFNPDIKIGAMIEVPAAALSIKSILSLVDFVSIGTNDLIQYLLAVDRNDESVNYLYNPIHPAVLQLIHHVIRSCNRQQVPVTICGEMAADPRLTRLLLGMGLRNFSMYPSSILPIKKIILNTDINKNTTIVRKILKTESIEKVDLLLDELNQGVLDY